MLVFEKVIVVVVKEDEGENATPSPVCQTLQRDEPVGGFAWVDERRWNVRLKLLVVLVMAGDSWDDDAL